MSTRLISPPAGLAVSMADAQLAARADVDDEGKSPLDAEILQAIRTYTAEAESETNRAIIEQTWRVTLDRFDGSIKLDKARVLQVEHVKFYDNDGVQQTLNPDHYQVDSESEPGYVVPAKGRAWPATANRINAIEVQYKAGYGPDDTSVPDGIKGFILARIAEHFETGGQPKNEFVRRLLWPFTVYS
ncbi:head-tail connector protein [Massilia sp. TN1-12]|uniref:head-tail connector protein n=1 Tax=Massilia paldalensis TaxID=3377675 RepID=UPI00384F4903